MLSQLASWAENRKIVLLLLLLVGFSGIFLNLGNRQFISESETRFAEIAREIAVSEQPADWVIQRLNGDIYYSKPPLFPMLIASSYKMWGKVDELSALFPSACAAFFTLLLCFFFWKRFFGLHTAFVSSIILGTSYKFIDMARTAQVDMVLLFFVTAALFSAYAYFSGSNRQKRWVVLFFFNCALATLTKGPIGVVLPCLIVFIYALTQKKGKELFSSGTLLGAFTYIALIGGWVFFLHHNAPEDYIYNLFIRENFTRYTEAFDHQQGVFYYFSAFTKDFIPWILFVPFLLLFKSWRKNDSGHSLSFFWVWFLAVFIFFSLSESKRGLYLLPLYPAISLLIGNGWKNQGKKWTAGLIGVSLLFAVSCPFVLDKYTDYKEAKEMYPEDKAKIIKRIVGSSPLKSYLFMESVLVFYMDRKIPVLRSRQEAEKYMESKETVYLLVQKNIDPEFARELEKKWPVVMELNFKKDPFCLIANLEKDPQG